MDVDTIQTIVIGVLTAVISSTGIWALVGRKLDKNSASDEMLIGLAHDRITYLGANYIERGWISRDEYENLHDYLYTPYSKLGGNGTAKKIMDEVTNLPLRKISYKEMGERQL